MSTSNVGAEDDEDPPSPPTAFPPTFPNGAPSQLTDIAMAPPSRPPSPNGLTNAKTTLSPATWGHQSDTALPAAPQRTLGASASSPSAFRVICVPEKSPSTSREDPLDPREQPQVEQRERAQNERTKPGGGEPRREEEEEELDKREEEEDTPPPPLTPAPKRAEPVLKPIPSPPWASDGFRPDAPPPPRARAREVGGGDGKSRFGVREAEGDRQGPGAGRGAGSSRGSGVGRKELQTEAHTTGRGPHAHAQRARGSISGRMPTPPLAVASAGAVYHQAPYANPYIIPYGSLDLQPYSNANPNAYPDPAPYTTATGDYLPRRANHTREGSSDSGGRRGHGRGAKASATREVHPSVSHHPAEYRSARQRHHAQRHHFSNMSSSRATQRISAPNFTRSTISSSHLYSAPMARPQTQHLTCKHLIPTT
ncbi:hypothetical protein BJ912DRAFT_1127086 [Pholiota molesta]|nr:hypothetical protein BJ912DRAFT_1127086 [Pholiota molesta]